MDFKRLPIINPQRDIAETALRSSAMRIGASSCFHRVDFLTSRFDPAGMRSWPICFAILTILYITFVPTKGLGQNYQSTNRSIKTTFIEPFETSVVASAEQGIIQTIHVKEGMTVQRGELIGSLDLRVHQEVLRAAKARAASTAKLDAATSAVQLLKTRRDSFASLVEQGHVNQREFDKVVLDHESAVSEMKIAANEHELNQIEVSRIEAQIAQRQIVSPMDGVVSQLHKNVGEFIAPNDPKLATIVRLDLLKAKFYLDGVEIEALRVGEVVPIRVSGLGENAAAKIHFISPIIDPDSGTGRVEVVIDNSQLRFKSGTQCIWELATPHHQMAVQYGPASSFQKEASDDRYR